MKKVILLVLCLPYMASAQIVQDFESGSLADWEEGIQGRWKSDTSESINGYSSLHHQFDNPSAGNDCIGLPLTDLHPEAGYSSWSFMIRHGCDPSSSNKWAVYLMSDSNPLSLTSQEPFNGFAVGVNLSGYDDTLRLWKISNSSLSTILTLPLNWQNDIGTGEPARLVAGRSIEGVWTLSVFDSDGNMIANASAIDDELFHPGWFILNYTYTSSRDRLLWFDDLLIEGVFYKDTIPPDMVECKVRGKNSVEIFFDEEPDEEIFNIDNYVLNGEFIPSEIIRISAARYLLRFDKIFNNKGENTLVISNLCDRFGNCKVRKGISFIPVWADPGDVIITEIMADPVPAVLLPEKEYLEITNRTQFSFNLKNWSLYGDAQKTSFPDLKIDPHEYIIVCPEDYAPDFSLFGKSVGLSSFPGLTDGGKLLVLTDSVGTMIHGLKYSSEWYGNTLKKEGGWSLEMIDTGSPFFTTGNWEASSSGKGGTPGSPNSVSRNNPDLSCFGIRNLFPKDSVTIRLSLSETVPGLAGNTSALFAEGISVLSVLANDPILTEFIITTANPMVKGKVYKLFIYEEIGDFSGNEMHHSSYSFGLPEYAECRSLEFNEILFNPHPGEPDYLEFYNTSEKVLDASRIYIASINSETGDTSELFVLSDEQRCIIPGSFYVVATDKELLISRYLSSDPDAIFEISQLPTMPDDKGHLILLNRNLEMIDELIYTDEMHFSLLAEEEGISLEKIRPEVSSLIAENWHSASENAGWGTPGKENSVSSPAGIEDERIVFSSEKISPDNDGNEDMLVIDIKPEGTGNVISVRIFDETGNYIAKLAENFFAGTQATLVWDGTDENGSIVSRGIYIVFIELYNNKGRTKSWKKVCAVIR